MLLSSLFISGCLFSQPILQLFLSFVHLFVYFENMFVWHLTKNNCKLILSCRFHVATFATQFFSPLFIIPGKAGKICYKWSGTFFSIIQITKNLKITKHYTTWIIYLEFIMYVYYVCFARFCILWFYFILNYIFTIFVKKTNLNYV